jgi:hypothetical protein
LPPLPASLAGGAGARPDHPISGQEPDRNAVRQSCKASCASRQRSHPAGLGRYAAVLERLAQRHFGVLKPNLQAVGRALEVVAPLDRRLRVSRVGEMTRIMNAGTILLDLDVALEIAADALELADHSLDLTDPATPFVDLNFFKRMSVARDFIDSCSPKPGHIKSARPPPTQASAPTVSNTALRLSNADPCPRSLLLSYLTHVTPDCSARLCSGRRNEPRLARRFLTSA